MTDLDIIGGWCAAIALLLGVVAVSIGLSTPARIVIAPTQPQENSMPQTQTPPRKQTSRAVSRLAAKILRDKAYRPTVGEIRTLAASLLSQDETPSTPKTAKAPAKR